VYLGSNIVKGGRADDREADEEDVSLRVGEGSKTVVILLSSGIPEAQANRLAVNHDTGRVVVEARTVSVGAQDAAVPHLHGGDVFAGKGISGVRDEETCLRQISCEYAQGHRRE
jgi:hypothetical protein